MNQRKGRPSFLRPLTQIAPLESTTSTPSSDLGPTTRGSIAYASQGTRPRSKSLSGKGVPLVGSATPTASISRGASPVSSAASSRRSSFAGHRRPSMVAREATLSRRDSIWSTFGDEAATAGGGGGGTAVMTQEEKAVEARKAFVSAIKVIWDSGVSRIVQDLWESVGSAWKAGDIAGLLSIDHLGLPRLQHARAAVRLSELSVQLQALAAASSSLPGGLKSLTSLNSSETDRFFEALSTSPEHLALLLNALSTFSRFALETLPSLVEQMTYPDSLNPAFFSMINLVTFLAGSSTDLRRAIVSLLNIIGELMVVVESASKAIVHIHAQLPSSAIPHPSGEFLYSPEHTLDQFSEIKEHIHSLLAQPSFTRSLDVFRAETRSTWNGLIGNARVARASRAFERITKNTASDYRYKLASVLEALDVTGWELEPVSSDTDDFSYSFDGLKVHFPALIPADVSVSYAAHSTGAGGGDSPSAISFKGMHVVVKSASYEITKRGVLGFSDSGTASIDVPFDLDVDLSSGSPKFVPHVAGKVDVQLQSGGGKASGALNKVWNAWLSYVVSAKFSEGVEERIGGIVKEWIEEPLFGGASSSSVMFVPTLPTPAKQFSASPAVMTGAAPSAVNTPGSTYTSQQQASLSRAWSMSINSAVASPAIKSPAVSTATQQAPMQPVGARAAFLASLRMTSGIDIRPLATGREVLESLANPFSGPNSAVGGGTAVDDDNDDADDGGSTASGMKSRSMSMAMSLTETAMRDSTAMNNIENPPRDRSLSQILLDDGPQAYETSALRTGSRRLSLAYTPAGEPSLDAYDSELGPSSTVTQDPVYEATAFTAQRGRKMSMAEYLDEKSERDMTTPEGIVAHARDERRRKSSIGFAELETEAVESGGLGARRMSMAQVTMDLQGGTPLGEAEYTTTSGRERDVYGREEQVAAVSNAGAGNRRKSMSEYLTNEAMADQTDPTSYRAPRRPSDNSSATPTERAPSMSSVLDQISSIDTTLPENIASPPRSRQSSFAPASSSKLRTKSFVALENLPSMAEVGTDEKITRDDTEADPSSPAWARRKSSGAKEEYAGIDPAELKKRRMSSFVTEASGMDATLMQNIQTPPTVDQNYHQVAAQPHSLAARRQSSVSAK